MTSLFVILLFYSGGVVGCRRGDSSPSRPNVDASARRLGDTLFDSAEASSQGVESVSPQFLCIHQRRADIGAPAHRERGGRGGFVRLRECTRVAIIESDERWVNGAFPLVEERTEGWISRRYLMDCDPCENTDVGARAEHWPPQPRGLCQSAGASGRERFARVPVIDQAQIDGGARGIPGVRVVVATYNVWELYDGEGEERYLAAEAHGATPAQQYASRINRFAKTLCSNEVDILLLQEVESATIACELAARTWPRSGWSCFATQGRGTLPQNLAIASRLKGKAQVLRSLHSKHTGPRDALELSLAGAGGLTVTTVHLKSSRGQTSHDDCENARQRMGAAAALASRYNGRSSVLIAGDFNVDPLDESRALYDRSAAVLNGGGFRRMCPDRGCQVATYLAGVGERQRRHGSAIDLAFYRAGGIWQVQTVEVNRRAPHRSQTRLGSDHLPLFITLSRAAVRTRPRGANLR